MPEPGLRARAAGAVSGFAAQDWDGLAGGANGNPFVSHAFLKALEDSGSVGRGTGWSPAHLAVEDGGGKLQGVAPAYIKQHSMGEYVFDHAWADAFQRAGGRYYPKLQMAAPFTPVAGPRLLAKSDAARGALLDAAEALARQHDLSSAHMTFAVEDDVSAAARQGWLIRSDRQFHWRNRGYKDFAEFLAALNAEKRKTIRRERARALDSGITISWVTGCDLTEAHWDAFFAFYMDTGSRKWGTPYLTRAFFSCVGATMAERALLVMASRGGRFIAGALNFIGADTLYGRHWGAIEHHPFLHFEVCYYQAIDFAIARGLSTVEAGAQGEHKLLRGYEPVETRSAHFIAHGGLRQAVARYLAQEGEAVRDEIEVLARHTPFRKMD